VILDEPFRGLDRGTRRRLLAKARLRWRAATLICITHDIGDAGDFDRVLVLEAGRLVEEGAPEELRSSPDSRFGNLVRAEEAARHDLWAAASWRRLRLESGQLREEGLRWP
jgi:ATP-binding cassette subfamily B protein